MTTITTSMIELESLYAETLEGQMDLESILDEDREYDATLDLEDLSKVGEAIKRVATATLNVIVKIFAKIRDWHRAFTGAQKKLLEKLKEAVKALDTNGQAEKVAAGKWAEKLQSFKSKSINGGTVTEGLGAFDVDALTKVIGKFEGVNETFWREILKSSGTEEEFYQDLEKHSDTARMLRDKEMLKVFGSLKREQVLGGWYLDYDGKKPNNEESGSTLQLLTSAVTLINPPKLKLSRDKQWMSDFKQLKIQPISVSDAEKIVDMAEAYFKDSDRFEEVMSSFRAKREKVLKDLQSGIDASDERGKWFGANYQKALIKGAGKWNEFTYLEFFKIGFHQYAACVDYIESSTK